MNFISLAAVDATLLTLPKNTRVSKAVKRVPTLSELSKLTHKERRNLANMVAKHHVAATEPTPVESQPKPTPIFFRPGKTS